MRILVTGATGFIGRHIVQALARDKHELVLTSRKVRVSDGNEDWRVVDYTTAQHWQGWSEIVANVDIIVNAVGVFAPGTSQSFEVLHDKAPRALFEAGKRAGVKRIIQISALGTDEGATSDYHLSKKRADDALELLGLNWVVLRPSLVIGGEGESWRFFKALAALPLVPIIGDGRQPLQPVPIVDVVKAVLIAINSQKAVGQRINIVGADCLSLENYLKALSRWMGCKGFYPVHIPYSMAGHLSFAGRMFGRLPFNREALAMLKEARVYEGGECQKKLGFAPTGVCIFLAGHPPQRSERFVARQLFLGPLLRFSLAFMWIMAGVVSVFYHPVEDSLALLGKLGLRGEAGLIALYGAALLDCLLGIALLIGRHIKIVAAVQVALIVIYTMALSWVAPVLWADPFGVLVKNIPIIFATLIMASWEE